LKRSLAKTLGNIKNDNMKPLILEYSEKPDSSIPNTSEIEYSEKQNLSLISGTNKSAIAYANLETETFTKTIDELTDSDNDLKSNIKLLMGTETQTFTQTEDSDSDRDRYMLSQLLDTQTLNESEGETDSDVK
tara:strand:+ start:964 stop:1362 length:399 start_codon:yes stop_codon:yes gene_type:complete